MINKTKKRDLSKLEIKSINNAHPVAADLHTICDWWHCHVNTCVFCVTTATPFELFSINSVSGSLISVDQKKGLEMSPEELSLFVSKNSK